MALSKSGCSRAFRNSSRSIGAHLPNRPENNRSSVIASFPRRPCKQRDIPIRAARCSIVVFAEFGEDRQIFEGGGVAEGLIARRDLAQQPPHDLAAAGLGQRVGETEVVGSRERADLLDHVLLEFIAQLGVALAPALE